jgi:ABC-type branched-subunit amino acid transport system substrate-binding protein
VRLALIVLSLLLGCHQTRRTLVPEVPRTGNAQARSRFEQARKFGNAGELRQLEVDYPGDPIVPWAALYAGIAAVRARDFAGADQELAKVIEAGVDPNLTLRAQLFLGIAKNYQGDAAAAVRLLAKTASAVENDEERTEYLAAYAYATAATDHALAALPMFDELWGRVTPTERAVILGRVEGVVAGADPTVLERVYAELADRKGPSSAAVGSRLVLIREGNGDAGGAARLRAELAPVRAAVGLPRAIAESESGPAKGGGGDAGLVGAVLPLGSDKYDEIALRTAEGLGLAAGAVSGKGVAAVETRAASDGTTTAEMVDQLAHANVIAVVGPLTDKSVDAAAGRAEGLCVPLLSLAIRAEGRAIGRFVFHLRHSPQARARVLARRALAKGITTFAILAPDTDYGRSASDAFVEVVEKAHGKIVTRVTYPDHATSFAKTAAKLGDGWQGVFVPDTADALGLIAPALANAGAIPQPVGTKKVKGGRPVLLLSTAEDLRPSFVASAGRHAEGALFAPGYYPDDAEPSDSGFVKAYRDAYGRDPGAFAAYAFDAAQLAAAAGAGGRVGLAATLAASQLSGVTGAIRFDSDHQRADDGLIYTVVQETGGVFAIRVAR